MISLLIVLISFYFGSVACLDGNGAIVGLIRTYDHVKQYLRVIKPRNDALISFLYDKTYINGTVDFILCHEGDMDKTAQDFIQEFTPIPIRFINVQSTFDKHYPCVNSTVCPRPSRYFTETGFMSKGLTSMDVFWFTDFQHYFSNYSWIVRVDDDCIILPSTNKTELYHYPSYIPFASPGWEDYRTNRRSADHISVGNEGELVRGMFNFTVNFAQQHKLAHAINPWIMPYTNVMYINLHWLRANMLVQEYMKAVLETHCMYQDRWGDLPLWGAVAEIIHTPTYQLPVIYTHKSHRNRHVAPRGNGLVWVAD